MKKIDEYRYKAEEGCFIVRKNDHFIMGEYICLGGDDTADNYEDYIYTLEEYEEFYNPTKPTFQDCLQNIINKINEYNVSENVDRFYVNDMPMWLNRELRNSLMSRFNAEKSKGIEITNIWYEGMNIVLPVDNAIEMLSELEIYASQCFDNTHRHLFNVNNLTTIDELKNYDYTLGYPEKLIFTI
jgi:hypothetical protein